MFVPLSFYHAVNCIDLKILYEIQLFEAIDKVCQNKNKSIRMADDSKSAPITILFKKILLAD